LIYAEGLIVRELGRLDLAGLREGDLLVGAGGAFGGRGWPGLAWLAGAGCCSMIILEKLINFIVDDDGLLCNSDYFLEGFIKGHGFFIHFTQHLECLANLTIPFLWAYKE
jgi:hypothetical protein